MDRFEKRAEAVYNKIMVYKYFYCKKKIILYVAITDMFFPLGKKKWYDSLEIQIGASTRDL